MKVNSGNNQYRVVRGLFLKSGWMKLLLKGCWEASGSGMLDTGCQWCRCILTCGLVITCYRTILSKGPGPVVIWTRVKYFSILLKAFLQYAQSISLKGIDLDRLLSGQEEEKLTSTHSTASQAFTLMMLGLVTKRQQHKTFFISILTIVYGCTSIHMNWT